MYTMYLINSFIVFSVIRIYASVTYTSNKKQQNDPNTIETPSREHAVYNMKKRTNVHEYTLRQFKNFTVFIKQL